jgi:hypothetical protein
MAQSSCAGPKDSTPVFVSLLSALALAGCGSLNLAAEVTRDANHVPNCKLLGEIYASSGWDGAVAGPGFDNSKRQLQNETAGAAATHCYLLSERGGYHPQTFGAAYRCQP